MDARVKECDDIPFSIISDDDKLTKEDISDVKASLDRLVMWLKHENSDIRKELSYLATKQESQELKHELRETMKSLEMKIYAFVVKAIITTIGIISSIQPILHFLLKAS